MPRATPDLVARLTQTDAPAPVDFGAFCAEVYASRYTGPIVVHFRNGEPREVDLPHPIRVKLTPLRYADQPAADLDSGRPHPASVEMSHG